MTRQLGVPETALMAWRVLHGTSLLDLPDEVLLLILALVVDPRHPLKDRVRALACFLLACKHMYRVGKQLALYAPKFRVDSSWNGGVNNQVELPSLPPASTFHRACSCWCSFGYPLSSVRFPYIETVLSACGKVAASQHLRHMLCVSILHLPACPCKSGAHSVPSSTTG